MPDPNPSRLYPDVVEAGGLAPALSAALKRAGSIHVAQDLKEIFPCAYAHVEAKPRFSQVYMALENRLFMPDFWSHGVCMAHGESSDLDAVAEAIIFWLGGAEVTVRELGNQYAFIKYHPGALCYENGTEVQARWEAYLKPENLAPLHPDLPELACEAHRHPMFRTPFPYTSLSMLCFSRCTGYPFTRDVPYFQPIGNRRFKVMSMKGELLGEGNARTAVQIAANHLPPGCGPARRGTADDDQRQ